MEQLNDMFGELASIDVMDGEGGNTEITGYVMNLYHQHLVVMPMENGKRQPMLFLPVDTLLYVVTNTKLRFEMCDGKKYFGSFLMTQNSNFIIWSDDLDAVDNDSLLVIPISLVTAIYPY